MTATFLASHDGGRGVSEIRAHTGHILRLTRDLPVKAAVVLFACMSKHTCGVKRRRQTNTNSGTAVPADTWIVFTVNGTRPPHHSSIRSPTLLPRPLLLLGQFDSSELAMAVAGEWDAQVTSKGIEPAVMPLMALASTAIDQVSEPLNPTHI